MQRKKSFKKYIGSALAAIGFFAVTATAHATLSLQILDGNTIVATVADGSGLDQNPAAGSITYLGFLNAGTMNVDTGVSKPFIGSPTAPEMHLDGLLVSTGNISLTLMLSDTDFTGSIGQFFGSLGGIFSQPQLSNITYSIYRDLTNALFNTDPANLVCSIGPLTGNSSFAGDCTNTLNLASPYSITMVATLNQTGEGTNSSFNAIVKDDVRVPEPAAIILVGLGLIAVAKISRRKEVQATA